MRRLYCDTSPLLSSTYKAYVTKKVRYKYRGYVLPPSPPPFLPWETKWFNPALLISPYFDSNPYSILSLLLLHLFYLRLHILFQHPISLQCLRYYYPSLPSLLLFRSIMSLCHVDLSPDLTN